jgi:hypothetical protein
LSDGRAASIRPRREADSSSSLSCVFQVSISLYQDLCRRHRRPCRYQRHRYHLFLADKSKLTVIVRSHCSKKGQPEKTKTFSYLPEGEMASKDTDTSFGWGEKKGRERVIWVR